MLVNQVMNIHPFIGPSTSMISVWYVPEEHSYRYVVYSPKDTCLFCGRFKTLDVAMEVASRMNANPANKELRNQLWKEYDNALEPWLNMPFAS